MLLKELMLKVSILGVCGGHEKNSSINNLYFGNMWWS